MDQPVPNVSAADVDRIARREFATEAIGAVLGALHQYGTQSWHREPDRVRAAILKLADGNLERIRSAVVTADRDFRDILCDAEYPRYMREIGINKVDDDWRDRIIQSDWTAYMEWFHQSS